MLDNDLIIFDIETDGLDASKIHCLYFYNITKNTYGAITDYEKIINLLSLPNQTFIGHNIIKYDFPTLEKILNKDYSTIPKIDTLPISWYLYTNRKKHSLESFGIDFKLPKIEIEDWENLSITDYIERCKRDVKINTILWKKQIDYLNNLYENDKNTVEKFIKYLSFKTDCLKEQEIVGLKFDIESCKQSLEKLTKIKEEKIALIKAAMPKIPIIKKQKLIKVGVKDDNGTIFSHGDLFFETVSKNKKIEENIIIEKIIGYEDPNPNSVPQLKSWLESLGWIPEHIKHIRNKKTSEIKKVPQISSKFIQGEICESIKKLYKKEPILEHLNGLTIISHRIAIFNNFLKEEKNGRLYPSATGFTNTLRLKHSSIVNLPSILKPYGKEVRSCLMTDDENTILCGSDLSNIEDKTKRHYIYKYDPQYVEDMNKEGYDAHLEIAVLAGLLTRKQAENHINKIEDHTEIRQKAKVVNFSCTYKCGNETLARNSGFSLSVAKKLNEIYWLRNKSILDVEKDLKIKTIGNQKWLKNPTNNFYYSLRSDKDKFSTLNQGTAAYCFDIWISFLRQEGIKIAYQCHDEVLFNLSKTDKKDIEKKILKAINKTNKFLNLNIKISCESKFGKNYAECH